MNRFGVTLIQNFHSNILMSRSLSTVIRTLGRSSGIFQASVGWLLFNFFPKKQSVRQAHCGSWQIKDELIFKQNSESNKVASFLIVVPLHQLQNVYLRSNQANKSWPSVITKLSSSNDYSHNFYNFSNLLPLQINPKS